LPAQRGRPPRHPAPRRAGGRAADVAAPELAPLPHLPQRAPHPASERSPVRALARGPRAAGAGGAAPGARRGPDAGSRPQHPRRLSVKRRAPAVWPKQLPVLTEEQNRIRDDFLRVWLEVLPRKYRLLEWFD